MSEYHSRAAIAAEPRALSRADGSINSDLLFETIVADLQWSALHIGVLSLLIEWSLRSGADRTLRPWRHVLHDDVKIMQLALRYCPEIGLSAEIGGRISRLYDGASAAKAFIAPLMKAVPYSDAERQRLAQANSKWRQLSRDAIEIMNRVESDVKRRLPVAVVSDGRTLVAFLARAANGETDCVGPFGEIELPNLHQRRRAPRAAVRRSCGLIVQGAILAAELHDVSRNGLGVICRFPLSQGQPLEVELDDGRRLRATVVRRDGDHAGLALETPLGVNDPLFSRAGRSTISGSGRSARMELRGV